MNELINLDPTFTESAFKTQIDNMFVMLHMSYMTSNLKRVAHFISKDVYEEYQKKLEELNSKNLRQMYDELNVKSTDIVDIKISEEKFIIKVKLISRYMDYIVDKTTNKLVSGNNKSRVEKTNFLTLEKIRNFKIASIIKKCPNCGASISVNTSGVCPFCRNIYNQSDYSWILTHIETID